MTQASRWLEEEDWDGTAARPSKHLSFLKFLKRYPVFLLAFGPPIVRASGSANGVDTSQAHFDIWNVVQVGWISFITLRAVLRLAAMRSVLIPKEVRSILRLSFFLGLLFLASVAYSPGRAVSAEFSILNLFTWICVAEFIVDVYRTPPNWMESLFHLRLISLLLLLLVFLVAPFWPDLVLSFVPGSGIRLLGGAIAPVTVICPVIAVISAYSFLYSLESRVKSSLLFLVGIGGAVITQTRGTALALILTLATLGFIWAKATRRAAHLFVAGSLASILLVGAVVAAAGGGHIWRTVNRGQDTENITSGSGRTEMWKFAFSYCMTHPQGMGYIAGFRAYFTKSYSSYFGSNVSKLGTTHNAFVDILADAGWLALALYLMMNIKVIALAWRFARKRVQDRFAPVSESRHALRCALLILAFCFLEGMESSDFSVPLRGAYYIQNLIIAIILGQSVTMLVAARAQQDSAFDPRFADNLGLGISSKRVI